jgi:16S rRNA (guanine966-N2)-methyltransferase
MLRIIGGRHRGRRLETEPGSRVRPTADRVREAVFNKLMHGLVSEGGAALTGVRVVDVFAGTGAMGLEALSRGAAHATFIDLTGRSLRLIERNAAALGEEKQVSLILRDGADPGPAPAEAEAEAHGLVFLDAPYRSGLAESALTALAREGWIALGAVAVAERAAKEDLRTPGGFALIDERRYGAAKVAFLRYEGAAEQTHTSTSSA